MRNRSGSRPFAIIAVILGLLALGLLLLQQQAAQTLTSSWRNILVQAVPITGFAALVAACIGLLRGEDRRACWLGVAMGMGVVLLQLLSTMASGLLAIILIIIILSALGFG